MSQSTTVYHQDATGLTIRIDQTTDEKGEVRMSCSLCNELYVKDGQVFALPFTPPESQEAIDRLGRGEAIFGPTASSAKTLGQL
jgi:hypothetical protein